MIKYILPLILPFLLLAETQENSSVPLPTATIYLIDNNTTCDETCLQEYLDDGQIFTFLALSDNNIQSPDLKEIRDTFLSLFNVETAKQELKIAMMLPYKRIGRYATSTSNALFAYLLTRNQDFTLKNFTIEDESPEEIQRVLDEIKEEGFHYLIAPLTQQGASVVTAMEKELIIYLPTINKNDLNTSAENIYFGAIDYDEQIDYLLTRATSPLVVFYDKSSKGKRLYAQTKDNYLNNDIDIQESTRQAYYEENALEYDPEMEPKRKKVIAYGIDRKRSNLKWQLEKNKKIQFGTFFLNTPVVKTTMILSQFSTYETNTSNILSTQINYDPLLFSMTQQKDREEMYIANSINISNNTLIQANKLLSNDIVYDWINYTTTVGIDLFYHMITHEARNYPLPLVENQVHYPISIVQSIGTRFQVIETEAVAPLDINETTTF